MSSMSQYAYNYARSLLDPASYWGKIADSFYWHRKVSNLCIMQHRRLLTYVDFNFFFTFILTVLLL